MDLNTSINNSYNTAVHSAYVIAIPRHKVSQKLAKECFQSCEDVGMPAQIFDAVDGTSGKLKIPEHLKDASYLSWIKVVDKHLSVTEVACALTHYALWCRCIELDQPVVILEHDAIMLKPYMHHNLYNAIVYLGSTEQVKQGWRALPIPPHGTNGPNYHFMLRAHAYAIDPSIARNLVSHVVRFGIHESLDIMIRADLFTIVQAGIYAYDNYEGETTIHSRKKDPNGLER
jgi:glycosyl transferase family 25